MKVDPKDVELLIAIIEHWVVTSKIDKLTDANGNKISLQEALVGVLQVEHGLDFPPEQILATLDAVKRVIDKKAMEQNKELET